jgi:UDP-N-acetylmuramoylalanine--D-glutamate ligase
MMREPAFFHLPRPRPVPLRGRRVLVLGMGDTGRSVARWVESQGGRARVADTRATPPGLTGFSGEFHAGPFAEALLEGVDLVCVSPGLALEQDIVDRALERGIAVLGDIELFAWHVRASARAKIVAITGTNGKTTVTSLTGHLLRSAGVDCEVAGNIGPAALHALKGRSDCGKEPAAWVLELSSYQLETTWSLAPDAAAMLNLTEDHLDRYAGLAHYGAAKARIFEGDGVQVLNRQDAASLGMAREGRARMTFGLDAPAVAWDFGVCDGWLVHGNERILPRDELPLRGDHNVANALAACALARALGARLEPLAQGLRTYRGLPHRLQLVATRAGVDWYDDSKGTNVGATIAALSGLGKKVVLIAGGDGKGQDFAPLAAPASRFARAVLLIGRDAPRIERALAPAGVALQRCGSLEEAVQRAEALASPGEAVLLSPACASFDMFRDYRERGEVFAAAVGRLGA